MPKNFTPRKCLSFAEITVFLFSLSSLTIIPTCVGLNHTSALLNPTVPKLFYDMTICAKLNGLPTQDNSGLFLGMLEQGAINTYDRSTSLTKSAQCQSLYYDMYCVQSGKALTINVGTQTSSECTSMLAVDEGECMGINGLTIAVPPPPPTTIITQTTTPTPMTAPTLKPCMTKFSGLTTCADRRFHENCILQGDSVQLYVYNISLELRFVDEHV